MLFPRPPLLPRQLLHMQFAGCSDMAGSTATARSCSASQQPFADSAREGADAELDAKGERQLLITKRALLLLRRATATYYFTSLQVEQVLEQLAAPARVEACVLFFARVLACASCLTCSRCRRGEAAADEAPTRGGAPAAAAGNAPPRKSSMKRPGSRKDD